MDCKQKSTSNKSLINVNNYKFTSCTFNNKTNRNSHDYNQNLHNLVH